MPLHDMPACDCETAVDAVSESGYGDPRGRGIPCRAGDTVYSTLPRVPFLDPRNGTKRWAKGPTDVGKGA